MSRSLKVLIILIWLPILGLASPKNIASVELSGLKKTKSAFINRYITIRSGDVVDSIKIEENRQRLVNLEMFSDVQYQLAQEANGYKLTFHFTEVFTFLPILSFGGLKNGSSWLQAGFTEANLGGRGQKLTAYYQYYDRHSVVVGTQFPRINGSSWDLNLNFVKWSTEEPLFFDQGATIYNYDNFTYGATTTYHFNFFQKLEFGGAYFTENYNKANNQVTTDAAGPESAFRHKILAKSIHYFDKINYLSGYLLDGFNHTTVGEFVHSFEDSDDAFFILFHDYKIFKLIKSKHNFAMRARVGLSTNEESPFAPFVLDSYLNIRGVGNRVDRGTGVIVINTEFRMLLLDYKSFAIQGVAFADTGSWRTPGGDLSDFTKERNMELFGGLGVRLIYKKALNSILRFDYGVDMQDTYINGFVFGVGQYF